MYYASDFISNETYCFESKTHRDNWVNANSSCRIKTGFRMVKGLESAILEKTIAHVRAGILSDHPTFHRAQIVKHTGSFRSFRFNINDGPETVLPGAFVVSDKMLDEVTEAVNDMIRADIPRCTSHIIRIWPEGKTFNNEDDTCLTYMVMS